jgi:hypothetical protein
VDGADLAFAGIARQAQLIRDREVSSRELVGFYLGRPGEGVVQHWHGMSVNGCLTRSVADTALWLDVTASRAPGGGPYAEAAATGPGRLRIGVSVKAPRLAIPPILDQEMVAAVHGCSPCLSPATCC